MPMTRIEQYQPPRPTIRELMEGRRAEADDGGVPPKGYLGRLPKLAYRTEDRAEAERRVRAREIQPWRGEDQRRAHEAGEKQKEGGPETGEGGGAEGREEREDRRVTRGRGAHLAWPETAKGHARGGRWDRRQAPRGAVTR